MTADTNSRPVWGRREFERELVSLQPALLALARSLAKHREYAEDLAQESILKALKKWESFEPGTCMKAWAFMIVRNQFYSQKRRDWRNVPLDPDFAMSIPNPESESQNEVMQNLYAVLPVLASLPAHHRDMIISVVYLEMSYEDTAAILDVHIGTVKSGVSRARDAIEFALSNGVYYEFDVSAWATASAKVPTNHPYYPIAKAYESLYALVAENSKYRGQMQLQLTAKSISKIDAAWQKLQADLLESPTMFEEYV